jgi:hypothetical protein
MIHDNPAALIPGTRFGAYEITAQIGEGGMGQVWRATDTTLGRQVAIKILPDAFASDPERLARFEREVAHLHGGRGISTVVGPHARVAVPGAGESRTDHGRTVLCGRCLLRWRPRDKGAGVPTR